MSNHICTHPTRERTPTGDPRTFSVACRDCGQPLALVRHRATTRDYGPFLDWAEGVLKAHIVPHDDLAAVA